MRSRQVSHSVSGASPHCDGGSRGRICQKLPNDTDPHVLPNFQCFAERHNWIFQNMLLSRICIAGDAGGGPHSRLVQAVRNTQYY